MTRALPFTQAQVRRAVRAAESAELKVKGFRVFPDGSIAVETGPPIHATSGQEEKALATSWDDF
jgi:hypothetical protein